MVKHTLQSLYDSSIAYGLKKALVGESEKETMKTKQLQLEKENKELGFQIEELEAKIIEAEEIAVASRKKFVEELNAEKDQFKIRIFKLKEAISTQMERM